MTRVERYTQEAERIAKDNSHGYSMENRNGDPDYDCTSLVINVVNNAGIPVKDNGATFSGDMLYAFLACGFVNVVSTCNLNTGDGMKRGDILLNRANHAAIYQGNGKVVHARGNEGHPEPGDQTGREILADQNYWNFPWDDVLRYVKNDEYDGEVEENSSEELAPGIKLPRPDAPWHAETNYPDYPYIMRYNDMGTEVQEMQAKLNALGYPCGKTDGIFGEKTLEAVKKFQMHKNLLVDGEAGPETLGKLYECYKALTGRDEAYYAQWENTDTAVQEGEKPTFAGFTLGETVYFLGGGAYIMPNGTINKTYEAGKAKITSINAKAKHPIHLVFVRGEATKVYGWVNPDEIRKI